MTKTLPPMSDAVMKAEEFADAWLKYIHEPTDDTIMAYAKCRSALVRLFYRDYPVYDVSAAALSAAARKKRRSA